MEPQTNQLYKEIHNYIEGNDLLAQLPRYLKTKEKLYELEQKYITWRKSSSKLFQSESLQERKKCLQAYTVNGAKVLQHILDMQRLISQADCKFCPLAKATIFALHASYFEEYNLDFSHALAYAHYDQEIVRQLKMLHPSLVEETTKLWTHSQRILQGVYFSHQEKIQEEVQAIVLWIGTHKNWVEDSFAEELNRAYEEGLSPKELRKKQKFRL